MTIKTTAIRNMSLEYCGWAAKRIDLVEDWPIEKWIEYDFKNTERRKSIRIH